MGALPRPPRTEWGRIVIRVALGGLLGSAAAVVVRLGGRFLAQAAAAKRMELELRTFEPFLANVKKRESVDQARLEIVDRSFGRAYETRTTADKEDSVELSALGQITDTISKLLPKH